MEIPDFAALLAGLALAHGALVVSSLPEGELLVPVALTQREGEPFTMEAFEAPSQAEAVANGKAAMERLVTGDRAWALVRDGLLTEGDRKVDALVLDFWGPGMTSPMTLLQKYRPATSAEGFQLLGPVLVSIGGRIQTDSSARPLIIIVEDGIQQHPKAGAHWQSWHAIP